MVILGIQPTSHNTSATLLLDGKVIAMHEEERFTRVKHDKDFPMRAIQYVLDEAGVRARDVDIIAVPYKQFSNIDKRILYALKNLKKSPNFLLLNIGGEFAFYSRLGVRLRRQFDTQGMTLKPDCQMLFYEHHLCHVASAYFASSFDEALLISWDGRGEWPCALFARAKGLEIDIIDRCYFPNSIGQVYQAMSQFLGFSEFGDEYKVMGLSAYGEPVYLKTFQDFLKVDGHRIIVNPRYMNYHIYNRYMADRFTVDLESDLGTPRREGEPIETRHMNVAASIQARVNEVGVKVTNALYQRYPSKNLCLAGGVAQNIIMNQHIYELTKFENIFVQPASHDGGLSLGAAMLAARDNGDLKERFVMDHAYWGKAYTKQEIKKELESYGLSFLELKNVAASTAHMLVDGNVVGWFCGRSEFGPRALGNRSILADPRRTEMKDVVNQKIKFREEFRPFAPSVLDEAMLTYFEGCPINHFMTFYARVSKKYQPQVPAITHVDGSARPQGVSKKTNPRYWELIKHFEKETSIPLVLNTSFNVKGEPIVESPTDAIRCYFSTGLDYLILEDFLVYKSHSKELKKYVEII